MKTLMYTLTLAILMVFGTPLIAAQNEPTMEKPMARQMDKLHSQMQIMQQQMTEINTTKNLEKRKALMQQHMQSMREGMMMMGETGDAQDMMMGKMVKPMMQGKAAQMACQQDNVECQRMQTIQHRQEGMLERMNMMQMMMQQMIDHQSALADQK